MNAFEVADAIAIGIKKEIPDIRIVKLPVSDGGDLMVEILIYKLGGKILHAPVTDSLGHPVKAKYGVLLDGNTAIIEMAESSGIKLISKNLLNPMKTTTYGVGQLIQHALNQGYRKLLIGLGGSATVDGGAGMLQALGVRLLNHHGEQIGYGGAALSELDRIDASQIDSRIKDTEIIAACDVDNVLVGTEGSAMMFGPQKGADNIMVKILDSNLSHFAQIIHRDLQRDVFTLPYGAANGGAGAALYAFLDAKLERGIDLILKYIRFEELLTGSKLIITGEGKLDKQTLRGKAPYGIAQIARQFGIPVVIVVGQIDKEVNSDDFSIFNAIFPIYNYSMSLQFAFKNAPILVSAVGEQIGRLLHSGWF